METKQIKEQKVKKIQVICQDINCNKKASFGLVIDKQITHCKTHKKDQQTNLKTMKKSKIYCQYDNCDFRGTFGVTKDKLYCLEHKRPGDIDLAHNTCQITVCTVRANYNLPGQTIPILCVNHKQENMINISKSLCQYPECYLRANYGVQGGKKVQFCKSHKLEGMIAIGETRKCLECNKRPSFGFESDNKMIYCASHKKEEMVDLSKQSYRCIESECKTQAVFNLNGQKKGIYCRLHKKPEMQDVIHKQCQTPLCDAQQKIEQFCCRCFYLQNPNDSRSQNYKTRQNATFKYIRENLDEEVKMVDDKRIENGCSLRRPDIFMDVGTHVLHVECQEGQHKYYDQSCENKRICQLYQDSGYLRTIVIAFNPDDYKSNGKKIKSCWKKSKTGILQLVNKNEWEQRLKVLVAEINKHIHQIPEKEITMIELFHDQ